MDSIFQASFYCLLKHCNKSGTNNFYFTCVSPHQKAINPNKIIHTNSWILDSNPFNLKTTPFLVSMDFQALPCTTSLISAPLAACCFALPVSLLQRCAPSLHHHVSNSHAANLVPQSIYIATESARPKWYSQGLGSTEFLAIIHVKRVTAGHGILRQCISLTKEKRE